MPPGGSVTLSPVIAIADWWNELVLLKCDPPAFDPPAFDPPPPTAEPACDMARSCCQPPAHWHCRSRRRH